MKKEDYFYLILRYFVLLIISTANLSIIYSIFTPLTVYASFFLINIFFSQATLYSSTIYYSGHYLEIISSCVAGAAYFLILLLNLSTPMENKVRVKSILFLIISFFIFNILRIFVFAILFANDYASIDLLHKITWYFLSSAFVVILWFANVKLFNIKSIPIYSDFNNLFRSAKK